MSDTTDTEQTAPATMINGFGDLYPRQVTPHKTVVLSLRNDGPTAHHVDINTLECDCRDQSMNQDEPGICDHLAVALFDAPSRFRVDEALVTELSTTLRELRDATQQAQDAAGQFEGSLVAQRSEEAEQAADGDTGGAKTDPVEGLLQAIEDAGINSDQVDAWVDDEFGSLQFEVNDMDQNDFDMFRNWCQDMSFVNWDRDNTRNYIKTEDFGKVTA
mgnify:CR=1 FL=1